MAEKESGEISQEISVRPTGWFFPGWIAFNVFGPFSNKGNYLPLLASGEAEDDKKKLENNQQVRENACNVHYHFVFG